MNKIYVDFHNLDRAGRVRLNTIGSVKDLNEQGIVLRDGLVAHLYCEEFEVTGILRFSAEEHIWVAEFNWEARKPRS